MVQCLLSESKVREWPIPPRSAQAALAWAAAQSAQNLPVLLITEGPQALEKMHRDLVTLVGSSPAQILYYPGWETLQLKDTEEDREITGYRLATLNHLVGLPSHTPGEADPSRPLLLVTHVQALMQGTLSSAALRAHSLHLEVGAEQELEPLPGFLLESGYTFAPEIAGKAQASLKGGILDLWPPTEAWPIRIEFYGAAIESIRSFNPANQRSVEPLQSVSITPASEWRLLEKKSVSRASLLGALPGEALLIWSDLDRIEEQADHYLQSLSESGQSGLAESLADLRAQIAARPRWKERAFCLQPATPPDRTGASPTGVTSTGDFPDFLPVPAVFQIPGPGALPDMMEAARRQLLASLGARAAGGDTVQIFFDTQGSLDHFKSELARLTSPPPVAAEPPAGRLLTAAGILSAGFVCPLLRLTIVAESDLYGRQKEFGQRYTPRQSAAAAATGSRVTDVADIEPGDLVVHIDHGVGKYLGMREILFNGQTQEVLSVEYADGVKIHIPVSQAHLLSRYIGFSKRPAALHRLGGKRWIHEKEAARKAVLDLAAALIETQAQRSLLTGHPFQPDGPWQREFEASFPYRETQDQETAIRLVKADMESARPMDRLICGDAGYGKTEVALRAAFKAAIEGKQTAMLVPTTVLAQQHFDTFRERLAAYPLRVEMLSRFCPRSRQSGVLKALAEGAVDIVIGTHALLQPAVRFKDLGLVIIDEEQRFGVQHKEWFKHIRRLVDVLTMTATPIPRTLYLSLTGARDMSLIQTAPRERMAIETLVARNTDDVIREAVTREVSREGQVFFIHNRVQTIDAVERRLQHLLPGIRLEVAHGQMPASRLEAAVKRFTHGEFDLLLCTTIVESGMDIPRANTILIDRADRFGIADLYQLRGRVGRSFRKAYAYLLLPPHTPIDPDARKRIAAVKQYSQLSVGFQLALRDLEIRGAGNLLGSEQSGHIAAVGFELYCQLLRRTIARMKNEEPPPVVDVELRLEFISLSPDLRNPESAAAIPFSYIEDERVRLSLYRKIAEAARPGDVDALRGEIADRFGPPPRPVERLLLLTLLRVLAAERKISRIEVQDDKVILIRRGQPIKDGAYFPRLAGTGTDDKLARLLAQVRESPAE